jgi:hypothetical protein
MLRWDAASAGAIQPAHPGVERTDQYDPKIN